MARTPLKQPLRGANRQRTASSISIPAGTGGLNGRDPWDQMKPEDAIILDNLIPIPGKCVMRNGYIPWATNLGGQVETLLEWAGPTSRKMIAGANGTLWDTTAQTDGVSLKTGFGLNRWQGVNFKGRLFLGNGIDDPQDFDGTTMSTTAWTGPTANTALIQPNAYRSRLYWVEEGTTTVWYGNVEAIQGALTSFDIGSVMKYGGALLFTATWSRDTGAGSAEYLVFVTTTGEILVYNGAFPSDDSWTIIAQFQIGAPLSIRAACKIGPELALLTYDGFVQFSQLLSVGRATPSTEVSDKLGTKISDMIQQFGVQFGWEALVYPNGNLIIVNAPATAGGLQYQFAMQTVSKAWCRFVGMNANTFSLFNNFLYFGGIDGVVYRADQGQADNGSNITADMQTAYNYCGARSSNKNFDLIRPIIFSDGNIMPAINLETDFQSYPPTSTPTFSGSGGTQWDVGQWDTFQWAGGMNLQSNWIGVNGLGYAASIRMQVVSKALRCEVQSFDIVFQRGDFT